MYNKSYILLSKHVFFCLFFFVLFCFFLCVCPCCCLIYIRAVSVVGRVQELLTTAHDGCKLDRVLKNDNVKRMEKKCQRRVEEERGEEDEGVSGCSPHQRTRLLNRWLLSLLVSPVASSWSPEAQSPSSSTQRGTDTHRDREEMNPVEGDKFTC